MDFLTSISESSTTQVELMTAIVGLFDAAPSSELLAGFMGSLASGITLEELVDNWTVSAEFDSLYSSSLTNEDFSNQFASNLLGDNVSDAGLSIGILFILDKLNAGMTRGQAALDAIQALERGGYVFENAYQQLTNKVDAATHYATTKAVQGATFDELRAITADVDSSLTSLLTRKILIDDGMTSTTQFLSPLDDNIIGSNANDTFNATVFDSEMTAQATDLIDGRKGFDTLSVTLLDTDEFGVSLTTKNVESAVFQAQSDGGDHVDASNMDATQTFSSSGSTADLTINHIQSASHLTTLVFQDSAKNVDFTAHFDTVSAPKNSAESTQIVLELLDLDGAAKVGDPFKFIPYTGVVVLLNGERILIGSSTDISKSYEEFVASLRYSLLAQNIENIDVTLGSEFRKFNSDDGIQYSGREIILTYHGSERFDVVNFNVVGVLAGGNVHTSLKIMLSNDTYTQTKVVFDNVGSGEQGGVFLAGAHDDASNIKKLMVSVQNNSWLTSVDTQNNELEQIVVSNDVFFNGNLRIGNADGTAGLLDVQSFDASGMKGEVYLNASLGMQAVSLVQKYNGLGGVKTEEDQAFIYQTGAANDTVVLTVSETAVSYQDFVLEIGTGNGDDLVELTIESNTARLNGSVSSSPDSWYQGQALLDNVSISTGRGNDTVLIQGDGEVFINTGSGDDVITLSNGDNSRSVIQFTSDEQGSVTVSNFTSSAESDGDALDFTAYLTTLMVTNDITGSTARIDTSLNTTTTAQLNSISILNFVAGTTEENSAETFSSLTADHLLNALNNRSIDAQYGDGENGIDEADLSADVVLSVIPDTAENVNHYTNTSNDNNYIVMVHNEGNQGEYKVFHLTSIGRNDFETAELIGMIDLGNKQAFIGDSFV